MEPFTNTSPATFETVWAALQENARLQKENDLFLTKKFAKTEKLYGKVARQMEKSSVDFDRRMEKSSADFDRRMKKFEETMGSWSNNHGRFAEEYFFNSFNKGKKNFFGERFDEIRKNLKGTETDDDAFRINFPKYQNHKIYLGLATLAFYPLLEEACISRGIAIIKQAGDTVVINDAHLRAY